MPFPWDPLESLRNLGGGGEAPSLGGGGQPNLFAGLDEDQIELLRQINLIAEQFGLSAEAAAALITASSGGLLSESQAGSLLLGPDEGVGGVGGAGTASSAASMLGANASMMNAQENIRQGAFDRVQAVEAFKQLLREFTEQSSLGRAGLGSDLFGNVLGAQLEANRRPISLVDQLMLSGQVGSVMPLSQAGQEQIGRYTSRPQSNLMSDLQRRLEMFTVGSLTPQQQVSEGFDPNTGVRLTEQQREYIRAYAQQRGQEPGQFADEPRRMQFGGRLRIDPNRVVSTPSTVAGPASVVDRTGRQVALMGEAGRPETLTVDGGAGGVGVPRTQGGGQTSPVSPAARGTVPGAGTDRVPSDEPPPGKLRGDEQIRFDELTRIRPDLNPRVRIAIAQRPGDFEQWIGTQTDPRAAGSRLIGGAIAGDQRFSPSMQRSLALGRAPSPGQMTTRDFASLPPDLQQALISVIGPDLLQQFGFELGEFTPTGRRTGIAGPVRVTA